MDGRESGQTEGQRVENQPGLSPLSVTWGPSCPLFLSLSPLFLRSFSSSKRLLLHRPVAVWLKGPWRGIRATDPSFSSLVPHLLLQQLLLLLQRPARPSTHSHGHLSGASSTAGAVHAGHARARLSPGFIIHQSVNDFIFRDVST